MHGIHTHLEIYLTIKLTLTEAITKLLSTLTPQNGVPVSELHFTSGPWFWSRILWEGKIDTFQNLGTEHCDNLTVRLSFSVQECLLGLSNLPHAGRTPQQ